MGFGVQGLGFTIPGSGFSLQGWGGGYGSTGRRNASSFEGVFRTVSPNTPTPTLTAEPSTLPLGETPSKEDDPSCNPHHPETDTTRTHTLALSPPLPLSLSHTHTKPLPHTRTHTHTLGGRGVPDGEVPSKEEDRATDGHLSVAGCENGQGECENGPKFTCPLLRIDLRANPQGSRGGRVSSGVERNYSLDGSIMRETHAGRALCGL